MKKFTSIVVILGLMISLTACSDTEIVTELPEELIKANTTQFIKESDDYKIVTENEYLALSYCEETANFKVTNKKDGSEFYTVTSDPAVNAEKSLFEIYYMDEKNNFSRMYSYSDSVEKGQYKTELIDNGIKITFTLGDVDQNVFWPRAITKDRFEEILEKIDKPFNKIRFKQSYFLPNLEKLQEEKKSELLKKYPKLAEEQLYITTQENLAPSMQKEISDILISTGYTEEDYKIDMQNSAEIGSNKNVIFHLSMYVTLEDDEMKVSIPMNEIIEVNGGKILNLSLLGNFASPEYNEEGRFLLPDGSGSLMNFYNGKGNLTSFKVPIYGRDKAVPVQEQIFREEQAYLPIYGVQYKDKGVLAVISEGEAFAEVHAQPGTDITHATVYPVFNIRQNTKAYLKGSQNGAESFTLLQKQLYQGNLEVTYHFFDEAHNTLGNMASYYADKLFSNEVAVQNPIMYLEFIGAAYQDEGEYSLGKKKLETFTTIKQVRDIMQELVDEGVGPVSVRLLGFGEYGLDSTSTREFKLNENLGTQDELNELIMWGQDNDIEIYIDVDPQYVYTTGIGDNFSKTRNTIYTLNNKYGEDYPYLPNTLQIDELSKGRYILNPSTISDVMENNKKAIQSIGDVGISFRDLGKDLNSDFIKKNPVNRQDALKSLVEDMDRISNDKGVIVNGANAGILPYVKHVSRVPIDKPEFDSANYSVAFLQMVLNGRIGYSDIPVNLSTNSDEILTQGIGVGSGFTYVLTGDPNKSLRKSTHPEYYSTSYDFWKEDILEKSNALKERNTLIQGNIVDYEVIENGVYKVSYSDGGWILCNELDNSYTYEENVVEPHTYIIGGSKHEK